MTLFPTELYENNAILYYAIFRRATLYPATKSPNTLLTDSGDCWGLNATLVLLSFIPSSEFFYIKKNSNE